MARLAAVEKQLYYPTDTDLMDLITKHLDVVGSRRDQGIIFDPCAGDAQAARILAKSLGEKWKVQGIELNRERCRIARMDYKVPLVNAAMQQCSVHGQADILFDNPPYDQSKADGERMELEFVRSTGYTLKTGGISIMVVPDMFVAGGKFENEMKRALYKAHVTRQVKVLSVPDHIPNPFNQVVIIGLKAGVNQRILPDLDIAGEVGTYVQTWTLQRDKRTHNLEIKQVFDEEFDTVNLVDQGDRAINDILGDSQAQAFEFRPLYPMSQEHAALVAAAGMLNGVVINNEVIRGSTYKVKVVDQKEDKVTGVITEIEIDVIVARLTMFNLESGELTSFNNNDHPSDFNDLLLSYAQEFVDQAIALYPPVYDPERDLLDLSRYRSPQPLAGEDVGLLPPQTDRASATLKAWRTGQKIVTLVGEMGTGKTCTSIAAAIEYGLARKVVCQKTIVIVPAKDDLLQKWEYEARNICQDIANFKTFTLKTITDVQQFFKWPGPALAVMKETTAKSSSPWKSILSQLPTRRKTDADGEIQRVPYCPMCGHPAVSPAGVPGHKRFCEWCGEPFWTIYVKSGRKKRAKWPLAKYIRDHYSGRFVLILDECFPGSTLVETIDGQKPIKDIQIGDFVLTEKKGTIGYRVVTRIYKQPKLKKTVRVVHDLGSFVCTADHKIFANGKMIEANRLKKGDCLATTHSEVSNLWSTIPETTLRNDNHLQREMWVKQLNQMRIRNTIVHSIEYIKIEDETVYDLEVEDTHRYFANGILVSNCHNYKALDSARGFATNDLIEGCYRGLQMTGTIYGGKASTIFALMYRTLPAFRDMYRPRDQQVFVNDYGLYEQITKHYPDKSGDTVSGYNTYAGNPKERAGMDPGMVSWLLPNTTFLALRDFEFIMPDYGEHTLFVNPAKMGNIRNYLEKVYDQAVSNLKDDEDRKLLSAFQWAKYGVWDIPMSQDEKLKRFPHYIYKEDEEPAYIHYSPPDLDDPDFLFPKEEALIRLALQEKALGRPIMVFCGQLKRRDPTPRLISLMARYGLKAITMYAKVKKRMHFIKTAIWQNTDVIFTNSALVAEGINIVEIPTYVWLQHNFNIYQMPQANRRGYRLTQEKEVKIFYLAYQNTVQAEAMAYIAEKLAAQQAIQGDLKNGLAALETGVSFVSELQEAVSDQLHFESEMSIDDLLPLPKLAPKSPPRKIQLPALSLRKIEIMTTEGGQVGFF